MDSPPLQIAHNERDFVDPRQILAEGTRYENTSPASSHLMVYPVSMSTEDTSPMSIEDNTPILIEDNTPKSTEDTTPLSSAYTTPRSAPASQHSQNSLNPRSCGCTETLLSKMSKKDREKHEISKAHRPDFYGKSREEASLGTHQCCCGYMVPRRDNHRRHVETCKKNAIMPFRCAEGHLARSKRDHLDHLADLGGCGKKRGRPSKT